MATLSDPDMENRMTHEHVVTRRRKTQAELEAELRQAIADIERGDFIDLTPEQLERCIATGESPSPDESRG